MAHRFYECAFGILTYSWAAKSKMNYTDESEQMTLKCFCYIVMCFIYNEHRPINLFEKYMSGFIHF